MEDEITTTNTYWTFCMTLFVFFFPNDLQIKKKKTTKIKDMRRHDNLHHHAH